MGRKILFWLVWLGFIAYALLFAPSGGARNLQLLINLFTLQWSEINPIVLSLLALVGIWIAIYSAVLFFDGRMQDVPFWPFAVVSVGTGVIGLLPYLALRESNQQFSGPKDRFLKVLDSPLTALYLLTIVVALFTYAGVSGGWREYVEQFQTLRFVNVMSVAVGLFWLCFPAVVGDDLGRRGVQAGGWLWAITLIPLFGAIAYLCLRPPVETEKLASA